MPVRSRLAVVLALPLLLACGPEPDEVAATAGSATPTSASTTVWHTLGTWSGRGSRQTESFDITSGALRITWETSSETAAEDGTFRLELHSAISGRPLQTIVDVQGAAADTVRVAASPRVAYLLVESDRLAWKVTLDEGVATPGS